jgi:DNA repair exonuclease SbcCD ATPase subunit
MVKVQTLDVTNVKKIVSAHVDTKGGHVTIGGDNGAGKTSLIDALWSAVGGAKFDQPLRVGAESGKVVADFGDFIVTRRFSSSGTTLEVKTKDGDIKSKPQDFLDKMMGAIGFDPMEFDRADHKGRVKILARLGGIDIDALTKERKEKYDERTAIGRMKKEAQARVDNCAVRQEVKRVDVASVMDELAKLNERNAKRTAARNAVLVAENNVSVAKQIILDLQRKLEQANLDLISHTKKQEEVKAFEESLGFPETGDALENKVRQASVENQNADQYAKFIEADADLKKREAQYGDLTKALEAIDARIAAAVPADLGIVVHDDALYIGAVQYDALSSAERIIASAKIGMKLGGDIRIMRVSDGSLLDEKSKVALLELADKAGYQLWVERVGKEKGAIIIEDGSIIASPVTQ